MLENCNQIKAWWLELQDVTDVRLLQFCNLFNVDIVSIAQVEKKIKSFFKKIAKKIKIISKIRHSKMKNKPGNKKCKWRCFNE